MQLTDWVVARWLKMVSGITWAMGPHDTPLQPGMTKFPNACAWHTEDKTIWAVKSSKFPVKVCCVTLLDT